MGYAEEHAEWNVQMSNYVAKGGSSFRDSYFYNGDSLTVEFENGSSYTSDVWAATNFNFRPANNIQDVYTSFVLNGTTTAPPAPTATSFAEVTANDDFDGFSPSTAASSAMEVEETRLSFPNPYQPKYLEETELLSEALSSNGGPYPLNPVAVQEDLGNTGYVTGYHIEGQDLAVLSLPSFEALNSVSVNDAAVQYSAAVQDFIDKSVKAGKQRLVIDLQANGGGRIFLGYEVFKRVSLLHNFV